MFTYLELFLRWLDVFRESAANVAGGEVDGLLALGAVRTVDRHLRHGVHRAQLVLHRQLVRLQYDVILGRPAVGILEVVRGAVETVVVGQFGRAALGARLTDLRQVFLRASVPDEATLVLLTGDVVTILRHIIGVIVNYQPTGDPHKS